jgi:hypothetical protein
MASVSFMGLPREIRDIVLDYLLLDDRDLPQDVSAALVGRVPRDDCINNNTERSGNRVLYEGQEFLTASGPLLRVNRQLRAEIKDALARLRREQPDTLYVLDVIALEEGLLPTWLYLPDLTQVVDEMMVTFRLPCNLPQLLLDEESSRRVPSIAVPFYEFMKRFLLCGPGDAHNPPDPDTGIIIKTLTVNFISGGQEEVDHQTLSSICCLFVGEFLYHMTNRAYDGMVGRPGCHLIMHERIGTIQGFVDGIQRAGYDLGVFLSTLRPRRESDIQTFEARMVEAVRRRRQAGLDSY